MSDKGFDIVVIGSGVIGHSIAYSLKLGDPKLKVAILGDPVNSLQASRAAAGMLAPFCEWFASLNPFDGLKYFHS